jgi:uncharacterized protein DUF6542
VTATRDRRSDPELDADLAWDDRPIIGQFRGLPWWGAVLLAFGLAAIAAFVDMRRLDTLGGIYQIAFAVGCLAAVCLVRRRNLFGPVVQPPLVFAVTAIGGVALLSQKASGGGLKSLLLSVALPLTSNFPTMAITTAVVVLIGLFRWRRERDPDPDVRPNRPTSERDARGVEPGLDDEPGQSTGGRVPRDRSSRDRAVAPPRRGRSEPDDVLDEEPPARRLPGPGSRPTREPREPARESSVREGARESTREPRPSRRDAAAARGERADRAERGRGEPSAESDRGVRGRGRGRDAEPPPRRREPGAESGRQRDDRGVSRRDTSGREGRDGSGREGRDGSGRDGREGRDGSGRESSGREGRDGNPSGRQSRRRPPESYR